MEQIPEDDEWIMDSEMASPDDPIIWGKSWREERDRYREALIECATIAGADVSEGPPTSPDVDVWAIQEVKQLRDDFDRDVFIARHYQQYQQRYQRGDE